MQDDEFEWDDAKSLANFTKHGLTFDYGRRVFSDPFGVDGADQRQDYGEDRFTAIGMIEGTLFFVAYAQRDGRIRIITTRRATKHEQDDYFQQNSQIS